LELGNPTIPSPKLVLQEGHVFQFLDSVKALERFASNLLCKPCGTRIGSLSVKSVWGHSHQALQVSNKELGSFMTSLQ
jgi:hypothetical protein